MNSPSLSDDPRLHWDRRPPRHAPPAITVPPPSSADYYPQHTRSQSDWTNTVTLQSLHRDPELGTVKEATTPRASRFHNRLTKYLFDLRMPPPERPQQWYPINEVPLRSWPPLEVEKKRRCHHCEADNDRRRRNMVLFAALVVILLFLLGNIIFLNVRVVRLSSPSRTLVPPSTTNASTSNGLSEDAQQCLSQYTLNAPSDPQGYPCSTCLGALQDVPSAFFESNQGDGEQITNAIQFCGLRSIFETASSDGQLGLSNSGWAKDVRFCAWQGVRCDGFGRVASIQLSFPAVPAKIPDEVTALTGLTSLQLIGDTNVPAGDLPASFNALKTLTTLHLESTAINTLPSAMLSSLGNLTTVTLVKNAKMTGDMSSGFTSLPLKNLVINGQPLPTNPVSALLSSLAGRSLQTLDLSSTSLSGSLPADLSGFASLVELHLDNNGLTNPLPSTFPPNLQALTLTNNSQLGGLVPSGTSFCALAQLKTCDVRGSGLSTNAQGCGACQFT
ncbi:hypothetical protein C8Q80DRAFT_1097000 [Daedaleopsis nitida]|nr:hypothetical protein C8Q80DRAFT_1097000 [Daedaleopsis nitida]